MSTRRAFLGTLGKALGAGGVLLPWAGKGALALPADLGKAAALPVAPTPLPVSAELHHLREVRRELHSIYLSRFEDFRPLDHPDEFGSRDGRQKAWRDVMVKKHTPLADAIVGRKKTTWQDCAEIAEVALHQMYRRGPRNRSDPLVALVFAVLSAGGQEEFFIPELGFSSVNTTHLFAGSR